MADRFSIEESFANKLDKEDPLQKYQDDFHVPRNMVYMDGNSLGLMSKDAEISLLRVIEEWKSLGIRGWLEADPPWFYLCEQLGAMAAPLVGAEPDEVVVSGSTTVNIHALLATFYQPHGCRTKILADELNFPTDIYALKSQIKLKGLNPAKHLLLLASKNGKFLDEDIVVAAMSKDIQLIFLPSVLYRSGQLLDMAYLCKQAHRRGIIIGFDCSHSAGAIPHYFDQWGVDFALWCSYKYLNSGPGSPAFIYVNKKHFNREPLLAGWFGYEKEKQFDMLLDFKHNQSAGGWQISTPPILGAAAVAGSLKIILQAGIQEIRKKSLNMTSYLIYLVDTLLAHYPYQFSIGTPRKPERRGGHIALERKEDALAICQALKARGIIPDFRPPNVIRMAPVALYNSYHEIWQVVNCLKTIIDQAEYRHFGNDKSPIT